MRPAANGPAGPPYKNQNQTDHGEDDTDGLQNWNRCQKADQEKDEPENNQGVSNL